MYAFANYVYLQVYCAMQDVEGGGGWTLVIRGVGKNEGCYKEVSMGRDEECNAISGASNSRTTFVYSDEFINGTSYRMLFYF